MKRLNLFAQLMLVLLILTGLAACNEVQYANRTLVVAEDTYTAVWNATKDIYDNPTVSEEDKAELKEKMLPILQITEGSIRTANVSLQTYLRVKSKENRVDLIRNFAALVSNAMELVNSYNLVMAGASGKPIEIPDGLSTAFGLLK